MPYRPYYVDNAADEASAAIARLLLAARDAHVDAPITESVAWGHALARMALANRSQ